MKRLMIALSCAFAVGMVPLAGAQEPPMSKGKMGQMGKGREKDKGMTAVMTGCIAEKDGHYLLNNAMMMKDTKAMPSGETKGMSYHLEGSDLKAHVGHKVEITGSMAHMGKMKKGGMDKGAMKQGGMDKGAMPLDTLNVKSVKMIAATCQ